MKHTVAIGAKASEVIEAGLMPWLHVRHLDPVVMNLDAGFAGLGTILFSRVQLAALAEQLSVGGDERLALPSR